MSPTLRRVAIRAVLAAGVAALAMTAARSCEDRGRELTLIIDPSPLGREVRAIKVDVFDGSGPRGNAERRYLPGEVPGRFTIRTAAPAGAAEVVIEVETAAGPRRLRRQLDAGGGGTVRIVLGDATVDPDDVGRRRDRPTAGDGPPPVTP